MDNSKINSIINKKIIEIGTGINKNNGVKISISRSNNIRINMIKAVPANSYKRMIIMIRISNSNQVSHLINNNLKITTEIITINNNNKITTEMICLERELALINSINLKINNNNNINNSNNLLK